MQQNIHPKAFIQPLVFLLLALASTWPLVGYLPDHLPLGTENAATVPLFNVWTVWWNADRAADGYEGYWDAPIFHPADNAFAFSEPMPLTVLAAPMIWATGNRILAYNCLLILFLCLNGWAAYHLLRRLHFHWLIAWTGGAMMELMPLVHSWLGVLQLVPLFGILWTFLALVQFGNKPTMVRGTLLGTAFAITYLMCAYYGLFLFVLLVVSGGWLIGNRILRLTLWKALLLGVLAGMMLCLPVIMAQQGALHENDFQHPENYLTSLSATMADYCTPPWHQLVDVDIRKDMAINDGFKLCPGFIKLGLAMIGALWGVVSKTWRRWALFCLTISAAAVVLSLGPPFQIAGWHPYMLLVDTIPGFAQARNVFRFSIFVHIMITLLAMMGLQASVVAVHRHFRHTAARRSAYAAIIVAGVLAAMEILPAAQPLYKAPDYSENHKWIEWLSVQTSADSTIVCIPFLLWPDMRHLEQETKWMYWQTFHHRRILNGYSGFFPKSYLDLRIPMAGFPTPERIDLLRNMGVDYCVVKRDSIQGEAAWQYALNDPRIEAVFSDDQAWIDIYQLVP